MATRVPPEALCPWLDEATAANLRATGRAWRDARPWLYVAHVTITITPRTPLAEFRDVSSVEVRGTRFLWDLDLVSDLDRLRTRIRRLRWRAEDNVSHLMDWLRAGGAPSLETFTVYVPFHQARDLLGVLAESCGTHLRQIFLIVRSTWIRRRIDYSREAARFPRLERLCIVGDVYHESVRPYRAVPDLRVVGSRACLVDLLRLAQRPASVMVLLRGHDREDERLIANARRLEGVRIRCLSE